MDYLKQQEELRRNALHEARSILERAAEEKRDLNAEEEHLTFAQR